MDTTNKSVSNSTRLPDGKSFILPVIVMALGIATIGYAVYLKHSATSAGTSDSEN